MSISNPSDAAGPRARSRSAILCAMPAVGHVDPLLVIGRELLARGWRVRMLTGGRYGERVRSAGVEFVPLPPEADTLDEVGAGERNRGVATINRGVEEAFVRPAYAAARALDELLTSADADVVLHDMTFLGVQTLFSRPPAERPLTVMCGIGPAGFSSRDTPPYGLGIVPSRVRAWGRARDAALRRSARWVLSPAHRALDDYLSAVEAPPLRGAFFMDALTRSDLLAQFTVPGFEYPRSDAPDHFRFYGPMLAPAQPDAEPAQTPDWLTALADHPADTDPAATRPADTRPAALPIVHVTQGTVANTDFSELIGPTLSALENEPVRVVVTTGGRPVSDLPPLPSNAIAVPYVSYDALLPRTRVFVTNGGYGGLHQAMRHGVPIVIAGDSEDKVETSARVKWSGVGLSLATGRPTADQVGRAVRTVLSDDRFSAVSRELGRQIADSRGPRGLVDDVEDLVLARST